MCNDENMVAFRNLIENYVTINQFKWSFIKDRVKILHYKKGESIHHAGSICKHLLLISYGIVRAYVIDSHGHDYTWSIHFNDKNSTKNNLFIVDCDSFINIKPSKLNFEALENCELMSISYNTVQSFFNMSKNGERMGRILAEMAYMHTQNIFLDRLTKLLNNGIKTTPYLLDKVPQYHIATLLGITPQSLSRIKNSRNKATRHNIRSTVRE